MQEMVRKNSTFCSGCWFWIYKKCSDIPGRLVEDPDFRCRRCVGNAQAINRRPCVEVQLADGKLDVVDNFVYVGVQVEVVNLLLLKDAALHGEKLENCYLLTCKAISLNIRGQIYNSCVRGRIHQNVGPSDKKIRNI